MERLQKIIANCGIASRRQAEELIKAGKVTINGKKATLGDKGNKNDDIKVDNVPIFREEKVYYLMNKPKKVICSLKDPFNRTIITSLIKESKKIFPVGRLDYNTTGTIILTNDGELSHRLTHPSYKILRIYQAKINESLAEKELSFLNSDHVVINEKKCFQKVEKISDKKYIISCHVGTYHHIKKMFELVDKKVINLTRIQFANLSHINDLKLGEYRKLKPQEINQLKNNFKNIK